MTTCTRCSAPLPAARTKRRMFCEPCVIEREREAARNRYQPRLLCKQCGGAKHTSRAAYCPTCMEANRTKRRIADKQRARFAAKQDGERPCGDCGVAMRVTRGSKRRYCVACVERRGEQAQRSGSAKAVVARTTLHDRSLTPGEVVGYLDLAAQAETAPPWERAELRMQMEQMRRRAQ